MTQLSFVRRPQLAPLMCAVLVLCQAAGAAAEDVAPAAVQTGSGADNFANLSLEELSDIRVTSVSRRAERLGEAAAAVFVIGGDDIRRAGATTLPEALRLAPNLQVARVDARNYAITARGFSSPFENKLLVLIDGRTVYSPLFSGVYWDAQEVLLDDVERIEVISGPGATLWGANAVNGVINVITKSAADTVGGLVTADADRDLRGSSVRYGAALPGGGHYRVYALAREADTTLTSAGAATDTGYRRRQAGFRADVDALGGSATVQGDVVDGQLAQLGTRDIDIGGANLLGRIERRLDGGSTLRIQAYLDHTRRDQPNAFAEHLNTVDVDVQHSVALAGGQQLVWGGGYRKAYDRVVNGAAFGFLPGARDLAWSNLFAQDDIALGAGLRLTAGLKVERNSYTGNELLPHLALAWQATPAQMVWTSLTRAVRVPSRIDRDLYAPTVPKLVNGVPVFGVAGGPDFDAEVANVAQLGYRAQPTPTLSFAVTLYADRYTRLRTLEPNPAGAGLVFLNKASGSGRGAELSGRWDVLRNWRLTAGLSSQRLDVQADPGSRDSAGATGLANNDPATWSSLRSSVDLSDALEFDAVLRHVGALPKPVVPAYTALDLRLGWRLQRALSLSLMVQNLFAAGHAEFGALPGRSVTERSVAGRLAWRF